MQREQRVSDMSDEVLGRQARARAGRTGETFEAALDAVLQTEAGRQLGKLRDGPHGGESAEHWQEGLARKRVRERERERSRERNRVREAEVWERFLRAELRELQLREEGQLAGLLGDPLPGESREALERLCEEDRTQAREGLVALSSGGKHSYKRLQDLTPEDRPARIAANRLRATWLKERRAGWLDRQEDYR
jgi:hypothetical protein